MSGLAREFCQREVATHVSKTAALGRRAVREPKPVLLVNVEIAHEQSADAANAVPSEFSLESVDGASFALARGAIAEACEDRSPIRMNDMPRILEIIGFFDVHDGVLEPCASKHENAATSAAATSITPRDQGVAVQYRLEAWVIQLRFRDTHIGRPPFGLEDGTELVGVRDEAPDVDVKHCEIGGVRKTPSFS